MRLKVTNWDPHTEDDDLVWVLGRIVDEREGIVEINEAQDPIEFTGVTIQMSGEIPLPSKFITLNAMTDVNDENCTFTITSFGMTETEARAQLNQFLAALIKAITPDT